jgi:Leucine-rich repeat (LRR) protein
MSEVDCSPVNSGVRHFYDVVKGETILKGSFTARLAVGLVAFCLFAGCVSKVSAHLIRLEDYQRDPAKSFQQDEVFDSFAQAFRAPEKVRRLVIQSEDPEMKHLPARLGTLVNLEALELSCLEKLEDLPNEIGKLRKLEELIIDNGNGCQMNVSLPRSIGQLGNLRVLRLYGALDPRGNSPGEPTGRTKSLPDTLANLQKLEELDLGRNGLRSVPPQLASLRQLKKLGLDYNDLREIPSFVGNLSNLEELSLNSNGGVRLPQSLAGVKGLRVLMGNNALKLKDQKLLRSRFPNIVFSFENEFEDDAANEEAPRPKPRTRRGRRQ